MSSVYTLHRIDDHEGNMYYKNIINCSLSNEEISLLTSLKHPNLVGYYLNDEQETNNLLFDYCEFGLFSDLDLSKQELDAHDLWSIRNQILQALKYLASHGLYHKGLNVSNVLVCSLRPFCIKLSLFSKSHVLIGPVNTEIPIQEFWKEKMNKQEEVCFDELIRSIVKSVFPYSIIDKNIVFTNPNTLEPNDLESLKALICSIQFETLFKSGQCIGDFSNVNNNFSCFFKSIKSQQQKNLFFSQTLLFHVFIQFISQFERPIIEFDVDNCIFSCKNKDFSCFAAKSISVSINFRHLFFSAFHLVISSSSHHLLTIGDFFVKTDSIVLSRCIDSSTLTNLNIHLNWFCQCIVTKIASTSLEFHTSIIDNLKITELELNKFHQPLDDVNKFPNLESFLLVQSQCNNFEVLDGFSSLCSLSIDSSNFRELTPINSLTSLKSLHLDNNEIVDISPLILLIDLRELSLDFNEIVDISPISNLVQLTKLSLTDNQIYNIEPLASLKQMTILTLTENRITDISPLSHLNQLSELSLDYNNISDLSPLSSLCKLTKLHLERSNISDVSPLSSLENLRILSLSQNDIIHISPLASLFQLNELMLSANLISDISCLSLLKKLTVLLLDYNEIVDISSLSSLKLTHLYLENNPITDISSLSCLKSLIQLSIL
ncbi:hypothetical protein RCL1_007491 [Eukaryota sp. TZLM3-RCL]